MSKKNLKRFAALTLAGTMVFGSAMTVFATGGETPAPTAEGVAEGTGSYEGGEMKFPTLSVTLPTIPTGTYDYIADPNGLIAATSNEKYTNAVFSGSTGVFFKTGKDSDDATKDSYTEKSAAQEVTNENAQDIDVTVKLEQKTPGDTVIQYAESAIFETSDKENKLYLAVTDDAATNPNTAALTAAGAATVTAKVDGVPGNYEPGYNSTDDKYEYTLKDTADLTDWNKCSFALTGAVNTNATWGDDVTFPEIKVTWSYKEHKDAVFSTGTGKGEIQYTTAKVKKVISIMMTNDKGTFDAMIDKGSTYSKATSTTDADTGITTITLNAKYMSFYTGNVDATITYQDETGATQSEVVTLNMN